jgi:hypothetical protein
MTKIAAFLKNESDVTCIEYGLIAAGIPGRRERSCILRKNADPKILLSNRPAQELHKIYLLGNIVSANLAKLKSMDMPLRSVFCRAAAYATGHLSS